jgi:hypothetical protein
MTDRELKLEDALTRILQWSMAYPTTVFTPLTDEQLRTASTVLSLADIDIGALHAGWARHIVDGIGNIAREVLEEK